MRQLINELQKMIQKITDLWDLAKGTIRERSSELEEPLLRDDAGDRAVEDEDGTFLS